MRIAITGGAGFLGSHLAEELLGRGHQVVALDNAEDGKVLHLRKDPAFQFVQASVMDEGILENVIRKCELVYHLAAVVGVQNYVAEPHRVLHVNINGTQNVLRLAHRYDRRVVFASSSEVYGRNPKVPWREEDDRVLGSAAIDRWCYSTSKAVGEHFCYAYKRMGLPVSILRYFNVYGPRLDALDRGRVVTVFLGQVLRGQPLTVVGDGRQTRCFTWVGDAVRATAEAGLRDEALGQVFNIGTDRETSILELAQAVREATGSDVPIRFVPQESVYGSSYEDVPRRVPDTTRMRGILGVAAETPLAEGLAATVRYFREPCPRMS